jgi:2-methylcitrate dehydratase
VTDTPVMEALLDYVESFRYEDVPAEVREYASLIVLYTLGASLVAQRAPVVELARKAAIAQGGGGGATIIGAEIRTTPILASMVNGVACRCTELNDDYLGEAEVVHLNDIIPPALAVGEDAGSTGRSILEAVIIGLELTARLSDTIAFKDAGWHYTSGGLLTVPCLVGRLRGLDRDRLRNAIAISSSYGLTPNQMHLRTDIPGDMMRGLSYPFSNYTALLACQLAEIGATGPHQALDGEAGFMRHAGGTPESLVAALRDRQGFRLTRAALKEFSSSGGSQSAVRAALAAAGDLDPGRITRIAVRTNSAAAAVSRRPSDLEPVDKFTADHSLAYAIASAVVRGDYSPYQYEDVGISDSVRHLMNRIVVDGDPIFDLRLGEEHRWTVSVAITSDRGTRSETAAFPPEPRLTAAQVLDLFRRITAGAIDPRRATAIIEHTLALDRAPDLSALAGLLGRTDVGEGGSYDPRCPFW